MQPGNLGGLLLQRQLLSSDHEWLLSGPPLGDPPLGSPSGEAGLIQLVNCSISYAANDQLNSLTGASLPPIHAD